MGILISYFWDVCDIVYIYIYTLRYTAIYLQGAEATSASINDNGEAMFGKFH